MVNDPIANMLTIIRNAQAVRKDNCHIPYSQIKWEIAKILKKEGRIKKAQKITKNHQSFIEITLDYIEGEPKMETLKRVSKPGRRIYAKANDLHPPKFGFEIISTPQGLMTTSEAKKKNLGGEILCRIR